MFAGDNSCLSKDRNRRRLSLAKIGQRLSGSARETASRKRSTLIGDPGRHGYRSHGHETAQALETTCPAHAEVASKTNSCQPLFNSSQLQRLTPLKNAIAKPAASKIAIRASSLFQGLRSGGRRGATRESVRRLTAQFGLCWTHRGP